MKIIVAGGLGFVGHRVAAKLHELGHNVLVLDNYNGHTASHPELNNIVNMRRRALSGVTIQELDVTLRYAVNTAVQGFEPDVMVNLVNAPGLLHPSLATDTMTTGLVNLLEAAKKFNVPKFVHVSSSEVYGSFVHAVEESTCSPVDMHGVLSLASEVIVKEYTRQACFDTVVLRLGTVYGPLDNPTGFVGSMVESVVAGGEIQVTDKSVDLTYVDDVADGIVNAIQCSKGDVFNIASGTVTSGNVIAGMLVQQAGRGSVSLNTSGTVRGTICIDRAVRELNYSPVVTLEDGLTNCYSVALQQSYITHVN